MTNVEGLCLPFFAIANGVGRLLTFSPEDYNVVSLDERCRKLERLMRSVQQETTLRAEAWGQTGGPSGSHGVGDGSTRPAHTCVTGFECDTTIYIHTQCFTYSINRTVPRGFDICE